MRVVVDSNRVQTKELARFLAASRSNRAVVTDWLMMEAYKGDTLKSIYRSLGVLARFPDQVLVLRNTGMCMRLPAGPQMAKRMVWSEHTATFPVFVREVEDGVAGDEAVAASLLWRGAEADERMRRIDEEAPALAALQEAVRSLFSPDDLAAIRGRLPPPPDLVQRVFSIAHAVGDRHRRDLGIASRKPAGRLLASDFLFRVGVATSARMLEWIRTGCQASTRPERLRNDYVDSMIVVYGTFFNGVMTSDAKLNLLHDLTRALLKAIGAILPPPWSPVVATE